MAAPGRSTTRRTYLGIALCLLAALFFVEAKTAWAANCNHSPSDIESAKAHTVDRSVATPLPTKFRRPVGDHSTFPRPAVLDRVALLPTPKLNRLDILPSRGPLRVSAFLLPAHYDRPPP